jgi:hypothetical protein
MGKESCGGCRWRKDYCWPVRETLLLSRSEEGAGSPLIPSLAPAAEREKWLLWFNGHRKTRAELGNGWPRKSLSVGGCEREIRKNEKPPGGWRRRRRRRKCLVL